MTDFVRACVVAAAVAAAGCGGPESAPAEAMTDQQKQERVKEDARRVMQEKQDAAKAKTR